MFEVKADQSEAFIDYINALGHCQLQDTSNESLLAKGLLKSLCKYAICFEKYMSAHCHEAECSEHVVLDC